MSTVARSKRVCISVGAVVALDPRHRWHARAGAAAPAPAAAPQPPPGGQPAASGTAGRRARHSRAECQSVRGPDADQRDDRHRRLLSRLHRTEQDPDGHAQCGDADQLDGRAGHVQPAGRQAAALREPRLGQGHGHRHPQRVLGEWRSARADRAEHHAAERAPGCSSTARCTPTG